MGLALLRRRRTKNGSDSSGGVAGDLLPAVPTGAGMISCEVVDPVGQPLGGAEIRVTSVATGRKLVKATTDPYGMFVAALPPGQYTVLISVDSLLPNHRTVDIVASRRTSLGRVQLEPSRQLELPVPGTWLFDPPHTAIRFIARHVGMANVHGRFERFDGGIYVADRMEESQVEVTIDASSITTGNNTRDNHLRSADFLDVEHFPYIHFASSRFVHRGGAKWSVQGSLTMHGVSRSVALDTSYLGAVNGGYGSELRCAALAATELHREDYTLNWRNMLARGIAVVGPTIKLELDVQAMFESHDTPTPPE